MSTKGSDHFAHSWGGLGRFLGSQWDRQLKISAYASFLISWSLSKFELIQTTLFFIVSKGGPKQKSWKIGFSAFFFWSPLGNNKNKSCLNKLKFWEASWNQKRSICWKFQISISLGTQKSAKTPQLWARWSDPCLTSFIDNFFDEFFNKFFDETYLTNFLRILFDNIYWTLV